MNFEIDGDYEWQQIVKLALSVNAFVLEEMPDNKFLILKAQMDKTNGPVI